jgi:hypothetical protein
MQSPKTTFNYPYTPTKKRLSILFRPFLIPKAFLECLALNFGGATAFMALFYMLAAGFFAICFLYFPMMWAGISKYLDPESGHAPPADSPTTSQHHSNHSPMKYHQNDNNPNTGEADTTLSYSKNNAIPYTAQVDGDQSTKPQKTDNPQSATAITPTNTLGHVLNVVYVYLAFAGFMTLMAAGCYYAPLFAGSSIWFFIMITGNYPEWFYATVSKYTRYVTSYKLYYFGISDHYPSFYADDPALELELSPWDNQPKSFLSPLLRFINTIPHMIALIFIGMIWYFVYNLVWIWMILTGKMPAFFHRFTVGLIRWNLRLLAYNNLYTTKNYPPFSTKE